MVKCDFYNFNGDFKTVNKTLEGKSTINGLLRDSTDVLTPQITLRAETWNDFYNYVYIEPFKRYYNVLRAVQESSDKITVYCSVDVLKTYENEIMKAGATLTETDNGQPYISVRNDIYNVQPNFEKVEFENNNLLTDEGTIIMITIKGKGGM